MPEFRQMGTHILTALRFWGFLRVFITLLTTTLIAIICIPALNPES